MTRLYSMQLADLSTGQMIQDSGGKAIVVATGTFNKLTLTDKDGNSLSNPISLTNGHMDFAVADTVAAVDVYGIGPNGHAIVAKNLPPSGPNEIRIDQSQKNQVLLIPFHADDQTGDATETDTGIDEPTNALMLPHAGIRVADIDATETIDVGTDSGDSGDADGFLDGLSLATAGVVKATIANGGNTIGALFEKQDSANAGDLTHEAHVSGGKSITYTMSAGADTASGLIVLPYILTA